MAGISHPHSRAPSRFEQLQQFAEQYWWVGFLGFWQQVHPAMTVFFLGFLLLPIWLLGGWLTDPPKSPTAWIARRRPVTVRDRLSAVWARLHPVAGLQSLWHRLATAVVRGRGLTPAPEAFEQAHSLRLPVEGEWTVLTGSPDPDYAHNDRIPQHRYAYDLVITDETGATHDRDGDSNAPATHYCYGAPVVAPAAGTVVRARTDHPDGTTATGAPPPTYRSVYGNTVVIDHGEFVSVLAHLKHGSITVAPGEHVTPGEQIGACGYSGNATEPQLHFHVQDRAQLSVGIGLPIQVTEIETDGPGEMPTSEQMYLHCGQEICHRGTEPQDATVPQQHG